jgi:ribosome-binding protein aMBF1 (putative translation factor)
MKCSICGSNTEEVHKVVYGNGISEVCKSCMIIEGLSPIEKPTQFQLDKAEQRYSVHERMMKLSGLDKLNPVSRDHEIAQRHIAKIKVPEKKQLSELLFPNYDWTIMMARRRRKMTSKQLSEITRISINEIDSMEKGILPKNFERNARIFEEVLGIVILKETEAKYKIQMPEKKKSEEELLDEVRSKLFGEDLNFNQNQELARQELARKEQLEQEIREAEKIAASKEEIQRVDEQAELRKELRKEISSGKFDFSNREKLKNITLKDLVEMKKEKERLERERRENSGIDDVDL